MYSGVPTAFFSLGSLFLCSSYLKVSIEVNGLYILCRDTESIHAGLPHAQLQSHESDRVRRSSGFGMKLIFKPYRTLCYNRRNDSLYFLYSIFVHLNNCGCMSYYNAPCQGFLTAALWPHTQKHNFVRPTKSYYFIGFSL